jgi:hypothetical protein
LGERVVGTQIYIETIDDRIFHRPELYHLLPVQIALTVGIRKGNSARQCARFDAAKQTLPIDQPDLVVVV